MIPTAHCLHISHPPLHKDPSYLGAHASGVSKAAQFKAWDCLLRGRGQAGWVDKDRGLRSKEQPERLGPLLSAVTFLCLPYSPA